LIESDDDSASAEDFLHDNDNACEDAERGVPAHLCNDDIIERKLEDALLATSTHISPITSTTHDLNLPCHVATPLLNHHQNYHWSVICYGPPRCADGTSSCEV